MPGYYTYRESIAGDATSCGRPDRVRRGRRDDGRAAARRRSRTQVSAQEAAPGRARSPTPSVVSGLGVLSATVNVELWGPYATREAMTLRPARRSDRHASPPTATAVHHRAVDARPRPATTPTASRSRRRAATTRPPPRRAARPPRRRSSRPQPVGDDASCPTRSCGPARDLRRDPRRAASARRRRRSRSSCSGRSRRATPIRCGGKPFWRGTVTRPGRRRRPARRTCARAHGRLLHLPRAAASAAARSPGPRPSARSSPRRRSARRRPHRPRRRSCAEVARRRRGRSTPTRVRVGAGHRRAGQRRGHRPEDGRARRPGRHRPPRLVARRRGARREAGAVLIAGHVDSAKAGIGAFFACRSARPGDRVR